VIDGRLVAEDEIRDKVLPSLVGPWYAVGWKMAALIHNAMAVQR
jgi:hypothetical protein